MDYLSRLVAGAKASPTKQAGYDSAQQRSIRFKRAHDHLLYQIWRKNNSSNHLASATSVLTCLENIKKTLEDEVHTPTPHLCARHVSTFRIYTTLVQVTSNYYDELIIHETLDVFKILIDCEEVDFLEETGFADALIGIVSKLARAGASVDTEIRIAEVLFGVASRIRLQPHLLPTWFRVSAATSENAYELENVRHTRDTVKDTFPLFYLTLDYVHHDGKVGDFARTGLLYIIESAASSEVLEKWIVESDLATLMASGLGALYSQLSRKLVLTFPKDSVSAIVTLSEASASQVQNDAETTSSEGFQSNLVTFLSYLVFWQDTLEHCRSEDIKQTLLDHFKFLFLQQLLYPSLIESSDVDGGSSVAVLTYLRCIVESIDHAEFLYITLQYLLALPTEVEDESMPVRPTTLARRRKSSMLITNLAQGLEKPLPDLFTLVDLIMTSIKSNNQQTVTATLRLVSVFLRRHHSYAVTCIFKTQPLDGDMQRRSLERHRRDTEALFSMAEDLIEHGDLQEIYEAHLQDARIMVESHCCSTMLLTLPFATVGSRAGEPSKDKHMKGVQSHLIRLDDPLTNAMLSLLRDFLGNDVSTNLSLTQAFATLASCGNTRLDGWLLGDSCPDQNVTSFGDPGDSDQDDTITLPSNVVTETPATGPTTAEISKPQEFDPTVHKGASLPVFAALDSLVEKVERFRHDIKSFDTYLAEQRHIFKVGEDIDKAVANDMPPPQTSNERKSGESLRVSALPNRGADRIISISERLMSETSSSTVSRSSSPRGRKPRQPSESFPSTPVGRLNHFRISPSPSPSQSAPRPFSPSPLHEGSYTSMPPEQHPMPAVPANPLHQKVKIQTMSGDRTKGDTGSSEASSIRSGSVPPEGRGTDGAFREISLGHLLTNVIILQEFVLELAAIIEVRASLFGEVKIN